MSYRFIGAVPGDRAGVSVSSAGDVDGDGIADLLIGANAADGGGTGSGEAYLLYGADVAAADLADGTTDGVVHLDQITAADGSGGFSGYQFIGAAIGDAAGLSVATAGDVNGDGQADLLIGANAADGAGGASGEVYLVYGADLAAADAADDTLDGTTDGVIHLGNVTVETGLGGYAGYQIIGAKAGDAAGTSVASSGDVDGDGFADLLIGANAADGGGGGSGEAYLLYGADLAVADAAGDTALGATDGVISLSNTTAGDSISGFAGYQFIGISGGDAAGVSVSSSGDVDGDGFDDLLIGANKADDGGLTSGEFYLLYGAHLAAADAADGTTNGVIDLDNANETTAGGFAGYHFNGADAGDQAGISVASAGDVDGDGLADLLVGAPVAGPGTLPPGGAYLLYGADLAAADAADDTLDGTPDGVIDLANANTAVNEGFSGYQFIGANSQDGAGVSVSSAGDVDGDGQADLLIGANVADGGGLASGEAYLLYGANLATADLADGSADGVITLDQISATSATGSIAGYQFVGAEGDQAGISVASAGDADGDGQADLLVGAHLADGGGSSSGEAYLLYGAQLAALDAADGSVDGAIGLDHTTDLFVVGSSGDDTIDASFTDAQGNKIDNSAVDGTNADVVLAGEGNDTVAAGAANDTVYGDAGDDTLAGVAGDDWLIGGVGNDSLSGGNDNDTFSFADGFGADTVSGGDGADTIDLTLLTGAVTLSGALISDGVNTITFDTIESFQLGQGDDTATGSAADQTLDGGLGADSLDAGAGADVLSGGYGADTLVGGAGNDSIFGGNDDDIFSFADGFGVDTLSGGTGDDLIDLSLVTTNLTLSGSTITDGANTVTFDTVESVALGQGNDSALGSGADETIDGGLGDDTLNGGGGNDSLAGGDGNDQFVLSNGFGADSVSGDVGLDHVDLSLISASLTLTGNTITDGANTLTFASIESLTLGQGNDTATGSGADSIDAGAGADSVEGGAAGDTLIGGAGNDTLGGGAGNDSLSGGDDDDLFSFADSFGVDSVSGGAGDDQIDLSLVTTNLTLSGSTITDGANTVTFDTVESVVLGQGDDSATGSASAESLDGGAGADSLDGGDGADTLLGGDGADSVLGNVGADSLLGGAGDDSLEGGADADTLSGGAGADSVYGGLGDDVFTVTTDYTDLIGDAIYGGDGNDTIDAGAIDDHIEILRTNQTDGSLNFYSGVRDGAGNFVAGELIGSTAFYGIESVTPCFTPGARVATPRGPVAVEDLRPGDQVLTRDNGAQPVAWVGCKTLPPEDLAAQARLRPVLIRAGALGHGLPERDMMFSPNHQILRADPRADLYFGEHEVLLAAKHLVGRPGITRALPKAGIAYVHFMFERHEVVLADGVWSESFQPGDQSLAGLDDDQRDELLTLFPALATQHGTAHYPAARRILRRYEARALLG